MSVMPGFPLGTSETQMDLTTPLHRLTNKYVASKV
jgi:hypothetical protein